MFDVTARCTYVELSYYYNLLKNKCPNIPVVICGNKIDCRDRKVKPENCKFHRNHNLQYYDISVKQQLNTSKPFLYLIRKLEGNDKFEFAPQQSSTI
jgi:GTP-binding nuclear protein Ran